MTNFIFKEEMVFYNKPLRRVKSHVFCMNSMMGSMEAILQVESQQRRSYKQIIIGPPSSKMPMIIIGVVMYVKHMHKGLL
jgi:hypothetical protein